MTNIEQAISMLTQCLDEQPNAAVRVNQIMRIIREVVILLEQQEPHVKTKKGYWKNPTSIDCYCSVCGNTPDHEPGYSVPLYAYCPYCGAEMEVEWDA